MSRNVFNQTTKKQTHLHEYTSLQTTSRWLLTMLSSTLITACWNEEAQYRYESYVTLLGLQANICWLKQFLHGWICVGLHIKLFRIHFGTKFEAKLRQATISFYYRSTASQYRSNAQKFCLLRYIFSNFVAKTSSNFAPLNLDFEK